MNSEMNKKSYAKSGISEDLPFISTIIPFEPKMANKSALENIIAEVAAKQKKRLKITTRKVKQFR